MRLVALVLIFVSQMLSATEYINVETPAPESAADISGPLDYAFKRPPLSERFLLDRLKRRLDGLPAFWRDTQLDYQLRAYDFERRNSASDKREAWAIGRSLEYQSGRWNNVGVRVSYLFSHELDADGRDTGLLAPGHKDIGVVGVANLSYQFTDSVLDGSLVRLYRQTLTLPFVNKHEIRMLPATHEGVTIQRGDSHFNYFLGHLTKFKDYDSEDYVHMSEAAGAPGTDEGLSIVGVRIPIGDGITIGAADYYGWDTFNMFFSEVSWHRVLKGNLDMRLLAQFTDQGSIGDELVGDFDTYQFAAKGAFGWRGAVVTLGASVTDDGDGIRKPWGGSPSYLSVQRLDFDRANEKAVMLGLSYNASFLSAMGFSSFANVVHGYDAKDPLSGASLADRTEYDLTVDYKPPKGIFEGLWVRARYNYIDIEGDDERVHDFRLIINYTLPFT